jgi:hypothetical protein
LDSLLRVLLVTPNQMSYNCVMRRTILVSLVCAAGLAVTGFGGQGDGFQRERDGKTDALKNAVEGKAPPPLVSTAWLNSKPLKWSDLKGKVVLLDYWAYW